MRLHIAYMGHNSVHQVAKLLLLSCRFAMPAPDLSPLGETRSTCGAYTASSASIRALYQAIAPFDAVVSCTGTAQFGPLAKLSDDDFASPFSNKLMGQVNRVRIGIEYVTDCGSFTLTSGTLSQEPMPGSTVVSLVNAAQEAAVTQPNGRRRSAHD